VTWDSCFEKIPPIHRACLADTFVIKGETSGGGKGKTGLLNGGSSRNERGIKKIEEGLDARARVGIAGLDTVMSEKGGPGKNPLEQTRGIGEPSRAHRGLEKRRQAREGLSGQEEKKEPLPVYSKKRF